MRLSVGFFTCNGLEAKTNLNRYSYFWNEPKSKYTELLHFV